MIVWLVDIIVVISLAWFVVYGFGTQIRITGQSMTPELRSEDVVLMNRLSYDMGSPKRFDVVVFEREDKKPNVKRVIGLPGETVEYRQDQLLINGEIVEEDFFDEDYKRSQSTNGIFTQDFGPVTLAEDEYFMLGDNRPYSSDSRWYGAFKKEQIKAKDVVVLFPFQQIGVH
mgnify:CR=1 FL=1